MTSLSQPVEATPRVEALLQAHHDDAYPDTSLGYRQNLRLQHMIELARDLERRLSLAQAEIAGHIRIENELKEALSEAYMAHARQVESTNHFIARLAEITRAAIDAVLSAGKPPAQRGACPLCGRTDPHHHTSGPLGIS